MILVQVCGWNFQTHLIHVNRFSEKYTYSCISHMKLLPINVCYELMT